MAISEQAECYHEWGGLVRVNHRLVMVCQRCGEERILT